MVLAGVDKFDNLFSSVVYADAQEQPVDLGEQLLRAGLARVRNLLSVDGPRSCADNICKLATCLDCGTAGVQRHAVVRFKSCPQQPS